MLQVFFVYALLASAITANKILLNSLPPLFFVGIRMLMAGIILVAIMYIQKQRLSWSILKKDAPVFMLIMLCTTFLPAILKAYALKHMSSANAALLGALDPFITALYAYVLWREKLPFLKWLGIIVGFFGIFILLFFNNEIQTTNAFEFISYPALAALLAVAIVRYGWLVMQSLLKKNEYSPLQVNAITMLGSGVLSLGISSFTDTFSSIVISSKQSFILLTLYTVVIGNVISLTLYAHLLKNYKATFLSLAGFSVPLFVAFYAWLYLNESLSMSFFIALIFTFLGLLIFNYDKLPRHYSVIGS